MLNKLKLALATCSVALMSMPALVFASEPADEEGGAGAVVPDANSVMSGLGSNSNAENIAKPIKGIFGSAYSVVIAVGIALVVVSVVVVAISLASGSNGAKREEAKSQMLHIGIAGIGLGAVLSIATLLLQLGASIGG